MPKKGYKQTEEHKKKTSEASKKMWENPETRAAIVESLKSQEQSEETKAKRSKSVTEVWQDPAKLNKMVEAKNTPESKAKASAAMKAKWQDPEYKTMMLAKRAAKRGTKRSAETKAKMSAWQKGKPKAPLSETHKQNIGKAMKGRVVNAEWRRKISQANKGELSSQWRGGVSYVGYGEDWTNATKAQIRDRDNHQCQLCGILEVNCKCKLHVHHIDYDKKHCTPDNLISLCKSCHHKTVTNRSMWQKYFTENMKSRLAG